MNTSNWEKHIVAGVGFVSNILLWKDIGYFDSSAELKPLLHLWSLGIEEQFYIFWPGLIWIASRQKAAVLLMIVFAGCISFYLNIAGIGRDAAATFYLPQTRFWELLSGSGLAWVILNKEKASSGQTSQDAQASIKFEDSANNTGKFLTPCNLVSLLGALLLAYGFLAINRELSFPGKWAVVPVAASTLLIASGPKSWLNHKILGSRLFVWFGLISFPLYLWHWPLLSLARIVFGETPPWGIRALAALASIALAWLTYNFVELPLRKGSNKKWKITLLILLSVLMGCAGYVVYRGDGLDSRANVIEYRAIDSQFTGPFWGYTKNNTCLNRYTYKDANKLSWWFCIQNRDAPPTIANSGNELRQPAIPRIRAESAANSPHDSFHRDL